MQNLNCSNYKSFKKLCSLPTDSIYAFHIILRINTDHFLNNIDLLIFVMEMRCVFFEVGTEF
jgi:hypothetical protein